MRGDTILEGDEESNITTSAAVTEDKGESTHEDV